MVVQPRKHFCYIPNTDRAAGRGREAELALELNVIRLLEAKPLLVCEESTEAAVAQSNGFVCTQLLRLKCIFGRPVEAGAQLVQARGCSFEIDTDPLLSGIGTSA